MDGRCKNCRFWDDGVCDGGDWEENPLRDNSRLFFIDVTVADDHNLNVKLKTGPEFGCVRFEPRE
jgi:hypothetical protein